MLVGKVVKKLSIIMKETLRYLAGIAGPSGYGSNSTAEQVTQDSSSSLFSLPNSQLTAIVTGNYSLYHSLSKHITQIIHIKLISSVRNQVSYLLMHDFDQIKLSFSYLSSPSMLKNSKDSYFFGSRVSELPIEKE